MNPESGTAPLDVIWSSEARADIRPIDRDSAMQIFYCLDRYLAARSGGVKKLKPPRTDFRLRCVDYRLLGIRPPPQERR